MSPTHAWLASEASWWWPRIADHLFQTAIFAFLVFAATAALRRGSARVRHSLWVLASLKLLVPSAALVALVERTGINVQSMIAAVVPFGLEAFLFRSITEPVAMISNSYELTLFASNRHDELYCAMSVIWLVGSLSLLLVWIGRRQKFLKALKRGRKVLEGREREIFDRAKASLRLTTNVDLILTGCRTEPTVARVWRPAVMLPESICDQMNDLELEAIMLHELVHVQRRDNLIGNVQMMICALLWFYPPVWFISRQLINEREEACDEKVLKMGGVPEAYASSILKVLRFSFGWKVAGVSGAGNGSNLRRRIRNIMISSNFRRSASSSRIFAGMLMVLAVALMIAAGVNTRARSGDTTANLDAQEPPNFYQRVVSSLLPSQKRAAKKAQPSVPPQPAQPPQAAQPPQPAPPAQLAPTVASQPAPPAPPRIPSLPTVPSAASPLAPPSIATPPTPAAAPIAPTPPSKQDDKENVDKEI